MFSLIFALIFLSLFTYIAHKDLAKGVWLLLLFLPSYVWRLNVLFVPVTFLELMLLVVIGLGIWKYRREPLPLPAAWRAPLLLLFVAGSIGVFVAPGIAPALGLWKAYLLEPLLLLCVLLWMKPSDEQKRGWILALILSGCGVAVFGIAQYLTGVGIPMPWDIERRVTSVFPFPNAVGLYLAPLVVASVLMTYTKWRSLRYVFGLLLAGVLMGIGIVLTQTEAVLVAVPVTLFLVSLIFRPIRKVVLSLGVLTIILIGVSGKWEMVAAKLTLQDYSGIVRQTMWGETVTMLRDRPVFGAGLGGYPYVMPAYHTHPEFEIFQYPHNIFLNIWTELGVLGLVAFGWMGVLMMRGVQRWLREEREMRYAWVGCFGLIVMLIHGLVDVPFFKNDLAVMSVVFLFLFLSSYDATRKA